VRDSTEIGGPGSSFPSTAWTLIRGAADPSSPERRSKLESLLGAYWKPVYRYVRARWHKSNEDAKDLTQSFFAFLLAGGDLARAAPECGSFRAYLKAALSHFLVDEWRKEEALKRGGSAGRIAIDLSDLEETIADPEAASPDEAFDQEWVATCVAKAVHRLESELRSEGRESHYRVFQAYYLESDGLLAEGDGPTHEAVASRLGLKAHDVNNYLFYARRKLRGILKEQVTEYVASEKDAQEEVKFLLGE
jgi:RNA polymerase sigma-70 factor (ECF subfamily)